MKKVMEVRRRRGAAVCGVSLVAKLQLRDPSDEALLRESAAAYGDIGKQSLERSVAKQSFATR
mgnify:CR=1 FL=1